MDEQPAAMSEADFTTWLASADGPKTIAYYRGTLDADRAEKDGRRLTDNARAAGRIADQAMIAWEMGKVDLVQRRIAEDRREYLAIKRNKPAWGRGDFWRHVAGKE